MDSRMSLTTPTYLSYFDTTYKFDEHMENTTMTDMSMTRVV